MSAAGYSPSGAVRAFRAATAEQIAFGALAATIFSLGFSIVFEQVFAGFCLLMFGVALFKGQVRLRWAPVLGLCAAFVGVAVLTSGFGPLGSLVRLWGRTGKLCWFALLPAALALAGGLERSRPLLVAFVAGTVVTGLKVCVRNPVQAWLNRSPDFLTALIDKGSMKDGQLLMLGMVIVLTVIGAAIRSGRRVPVWLWLTLTLQAAGLMVNFKRGSWFCAFALGGLIVLMHLRWRAWLILAAAVAALLLLPPVQTRLGQLRREFNPEGGGRLTMWFKVAPRLIHEHPFGIGYGTLTPRIMRSADRHVEPNRNHLHSNVAQILVETGWLGFALYAAWTLASFRNHFRWLARARGESQTAQSVAFAFLLLFAGLLLNGLVEYNFGDTQLMMLYAIVMGIAARQALPSCVP